MFPGGQSTTSGDSNQKDGNQNNAQQRARMAFGQFAGVASTVVQQLTVRKYALPDKNVASQVLMYRQLLHTQCKPGLKLSRDYQGTPAQQAVLHMPWWCEGILETNKMIISYDNLIKRLWLQGAIISTMNESNSSHAIVEENKATALMNTEKVLFGSFDDDKTTTTTTQQVDASNIASSFGGADNKPNKNIETYLNEDGMPPTPHEFWVSRLGFQQPDPVTDFRSGGVLSLAMMVHIVESCPYIYERYRRYPLPVGDASVLPFGITCINVTDMMSKFLMLSKSTDKMDALLSQKPFWKMFADPSSLLVCQELAMDMLADVVQELHLTRTIEMEAEAEEQQENTNTKPNNISNNNHNLDTCKVTVFDFSHILAITEKRVENELLGAGPTTVNDLRQIHARVKNKYMNQLQHTINKIRKEKKDKKQKSNATNRSNNKDKLDNISKETDSTIESSPIPVITPQKVKDEVLKHVTGFGVVANDFFSSVKSPHDFKISSQQLRNVTMPFAFGSSSSSRTNKNNDEDEANNNNTNNNNTTSQENTDEKKSTTTSDLSNFLDDPNDDEIIDKFLSNSTTTTTTTTTTNKEDNSQQQVNSNNNQMFIADFLMDDGEWNTDIQNATDGITNFSIGGEDDDDEDEGEFL